MKLTENQLRQQMTGATRSVSPAVQQAVIDVLIGGMKWRRAAIKNDVTESGIYRCLKRLGIKSTAVGNG